MKISGALKKLIKKLEYYEGMGIPSDILRKAYPVNFDRAKQIIEKRKIKN